MHALLLRSLYGCRKASGGEALHKAAAAVLACNPGSHLLNLDVANAFQRIDRNAVQTAARDRTPDLEPWLQVIVGFESEIGFPITDESPYTFRQRAGSGRDARCLPCCSPLPRHVWSRS